MLISKGNQLLVSLLYLCVELVDLHLSRLLLLRLALKLVVQSLDLLVELEDLILKITLLFLLHSERLSVLHLRFL